jgi:2-phosphoglycerate kinase
LKTFVINKQEHTRVPFLRGILIRNLIHSGLPFDQSFELANEVRTALADTDEISTQQLRKLVDSRLGAMHEESILAQYRAPSSAPTRIRVIDLNGTESAFSRDKHQRYLQSSAIRAADSEQITTGVYNQLLASGVSSISTRQLGYLTYLCLQQELGKAEASQYLAWTEFQHSDRPLLLLICGAVGSGKSSIANEIGHRLDIVRTQSTDMLREVMRSMIPRKLMPVLHCSSFDAWRTLPIQDKKDRNKDLLVAEGYRVQTDLLALACEAVMLRAIRESTPLILEGVHVHPSLAQALPPDSDAVVVHVTLGVMQEKELKARLLGRGTNEPRRRARKYLNKFDSIWRLQSVVLGEAERCDTPIIPNVDRETAIFQLISVVNQEVLRHFHGSPAKVFGGIVGRTRKQLAGKTWQKAVPLLARASKPMRDRAAR